MVDTSSIIEGTVKFRDGKKWKSRWCVMRKLSPVADCLHLQLYRDSKDRYKQGQTKASLSLQHFLGVESGFTLDKESNTIAIICQDVIVVLAFDTRERLIQWQVKISINLGDDQQFLILVSSAPSKAKIASGPARMHVQDHRFCLTSGVPPRLMGVWEIAHLRRYGVVEGRFCFEGGSRCAKGEGLHVLVTDQGEEITDSLKLASQGLLAARRRPASRKSSNIDSPRRMPVRPETRISDLSCAESFLNASQNAEMARSIYGDESCCNHTSDATPCTCRTSSPFWSTESAIGHHNHGDLDSNYGCGDTASVSELHDIVHNETWTGEMGYNSRSGMPASLERCMSCISKLGAPSMSRSSTATVSGTPGAAPLFSPAWTMENSICNLHTQQNSTSVRSTGGCSSDRMSLCSHGSSSGNSEYSVPRNPNSNTQECSWYERTHGVTTPPPQPLPIPPKSPKVQSIAQSTSSRNTSPSSHPAQCQCCVPARPPKPSQLSQSANNSPSKKPPKKPPMPLPIAAPLNPSVCSCNHTQQDYNPMVGPYENYDVPKMPFLVEPKNEDGKRPNETPEHYDTPKKIKECLAAEIMGQFGNYDTPNTVNVRKACGCILKFNKPNVFAEPKIVDNPEDIRPVDCPCRRLMCWPGNWMTLPYCRRGNGIENTAPLPKVTINGEGKMPFVQSNGDTAIYATVDKSKKTNRKTLEINCKCSEPSSKSEDPAATNYVNIDPVNLIPEPVEQHSAECANYANIDFAQSLEYYENARELLQRAGITKEEMERLDSETAVKEKLSYIITNGVKVCNKCGHACNRNKDDHEKEEETPTTTDVNKQDDYLMMEPAKDCKHDKKSPDSNAKQNKNFPGYLPMSPVSNSTTNCSKTDLLKQCVNKLICEKSASNPSLIGPAVDRSRKRSDSDVRIPGSAMLMSHHSGNSPYLRRQILDSTDSIDRRAFLARKRSSSADSTRYIDDETESPLSRTTSPSSETLRKSSVHSLNSAVEQVPCSEHRNSSPCLHQETESCYSSDCCQKGSVIDVNSNETEDEVSSNTDSLRTQIPENMISQQSVNIRRSSSVPCKSGQNRDSSSSNDSGVSTGSLKQRGGDFAEFELPLTTSMSSRRHHHAISQQSQMQTNCLHSSLPRRSKSSDPLRELTFQFQKVKIPAKSSSAEAEVPICANKNGKGFSSPSDGTMGPPYMDSRSTSSGTSDMSDYIETLSVSSHSSSDAQDLRLIRPATSTLRPRSGKEYLNIDRAMLISEGKGCTSGISSQQMRSLLNNAAYANITPVPEKSESPSPGYMSGSSPAQEIPGQQTHFTFQKTQ